MEVTSILCIEVVAVRCDELEVRDELCSASVLSVLALDEHRLQIHRIRYDSGIGRKDSCNGLYKLKVFGVIAKRLDNSLEKIVEVHQLAAGTATRSPSRVALALLSLSLCLSHLALVSNLDLHTEFIFFEWSSNLQLHVARDLALLVGDSFFPLAFSLREGEERALARASVVAVEAARGATRSFTLLDSLPACKSLLELLKCLATSLLFLKEL
mmetsp:Transcript_23530/g.72026  ORF Transcript_23530/g.72026 Transcript_23530/m.72026 type:complete len:213 (+) Transcript_23530:932-1570(+)